MQTVKITYLYNSGFAVELSEHFLVFDYYMDHVDTGRRGMAGGVLTARDFPADKQVLVFVSHRHADHYNSVIFKWRRFLGDRVHYILSSDVPVREKALRLEPYQAQQVAGAMVSTFGSTDEGVSFFVEVEGVRIFHAGDFNLWHWQEESTVAEVNAAKRAFLQEMEKIKSSISALDIPFFPVDPRQGRGFEAGARHFMRVMQPKVLVPMHFGEQVDAVQRFIAAAPAAHTRIFRIAARGDTLQVDL